MPCQRCTCTTLKERGKHSFLVTAAASAAAAAELFVKNALLAYRLMQSGLDMITEFFCGYASSVEHLGRQNECLTLCKHPHGSSALSKVAHRFCKVDRKVVAPIRKKERAAARQTL
jgi:hypothetical protein